MTDTLKNDSVRTLITLSRELGSLMTTTSLLQSKELPDEALRPIAGQVNKHVYEVRKLLNTFLKGLDLSSETVSVLDEGVLDNRDEADDHEIDFDSEAVASVLSHEAVPVDGSIASDSVDLVSDSDIIEETSGDTDEALDSETATVDELEATKNDVVAELVSDLENDVLKVGEGVQISEDATVGGLNLQAMEASSAIGGAEDSVLNLPGSDVKVSIDELDKTETVVDESILKATIDEPIHDVGPKEKSVTLDDIASDGASDEEELDLDDDL